MNHLYTSWESTSLWSAVDDAIQDLVENRDLVESTSRPYIVGYVCKKIAEDSQRIAA